MADRVGQQLGNYQLIRLLGQGGFAEVYLGEHVYLNTQAAVKVLRAQLARDEANQFRTEARTLAHLNHPHIVRVLEFGLEGDTPFLIMDYAPHGTLRQRHPKGMILPLKTVVLYVKQVADALQYAHDSKLIHRDVKPENMLLGRNNEILLSDFGIATVAQSSQAQGTQTVAGTVTYMAPEQIQGKPVAASDQYALGIVVYEWLTGAPPFRGTFAEVTTQHMYTSPPSLQQQITSIPAAVEQVVFKALEKTPANRFANVRDFATALEQAVLSPPVTVPKVVMPSPPPTPQPQIVQVAPPSLGPIGPSTLPALPRPSVSNVLWPTFSISIEERRAISTGKLPQEQLGMTGKLQTTPLGPLPFMVTPPPVTISQAFIQNQGVQQVITPPPIQHPPASQAGGSTMEIARSTGSSSPKPSSQPAAPVAAQASGGMGIVRSSGTPGSPTAPSGIPLSTTAGHWRGAISLTLACASILFALFALPALIWAPYIVYALASIAFLFGVLAMRKDVGKVKAVAGWSISLSVLTALFEAARLLFHF